MLRSILVVHSGNSAHSGKRMHRAYSNISLANVEYFHLLVTVPLGVGVPGLSHSLGTVYYRCEAGSKFRLRQLAFTSKLLLVTDGCNSHFLYFSLE